MCDHGHSERFTRPTYLTRRPSQRRSCLSREDPRPPWLRPVSCLLLALVFLNYSWPPLVDASLLLALLSCRPTVKVVVRRVVVCTWYTEPHSGSAARNACVYIPSAAGYTARAKGRYNCAASTLRARSPSGTLRLFAGRGAVWRGFAPLGWDEIDCSSEVPVQSRSEPVPPRVKNIAVAISCFRDCCQIHKDGCPRQDGQDCHSSKTLFDFCLLSSTHDATFRKGKGRELSPSMPSIHPSSIVKLYFHPPSVLISRKLGKINFKIAFQTPRLCSSPLCNPFVNLSLHDELRDLANGNCLTLGNIVRNLISRRVDV